MVLTLALWVMVKLQKLNYFFLGLLASAALASALDLIPYVGHYLAFPVLYFCIWKVTKASLMPDAVFTVAIAYALMFAVQVLLLTALLPPLHPLVTEDSLLAPKPPRLADPIPAFVVVKRTNQPAPPVDRKTADDWLKEVAFKGVTENGAKSSLLLQANQSLYSLELNQRTTVKTGTGSCEMMLVNVSDNWATVEVNGEAAYFRLH